MANNQMVKAIPKPELWCKWRITTDPQDCEEILWLYKHSDLQQLDQGYFVLTKHQAIVYQLCCKTDQVDFEYC